MEAQDGRAACICDEISFLEDSRWESIGLGQEKSSRGITDQKRGAYEKS